MRKSLVVFAVLLAACSSGGNPGGSGDPGGGDQPGGSTGGDTTPPSEGGVTLDGDTATVTLTSFPVGAGEELFKCQSFANPFGADAEIVAWQSHMTPHSHHMLFLYDEANQDVPLADCSGLTFGPMAYGAGQPESSLSYPDGVAMLVKADQGFRMAVHYLNATQEPITASVQVVMRRAPAGTITQYAGVYFLNNITGVNIPPMSDKTLTASYKLPHDINVLTANGHMHMRSQSFTATVDGNALYQTDSWDNAPVQLYAPPPVLAAGSTLTWSCQIHNDTENTLTFGESANVNEMCIFTGQYFPVADLNRPTININR